MNPRDKKHETELPESDDISRLYSGMSREEPPAELDARILAQARRAVEHSQKRREWFGPWQQPIAVAAVLVLSFTLLMLHPSPKIARSPAPMVADDAVLLQEPVAMESAREDKADAGVTEQTATRAAVKKTETSAQRKMKSPQDAGSGVAPVLSDVQSANELSGPPPAAPAREFPGEAAILDRSRETDALSKPAAAPRLETFKQAPAASEVEEVIVQGARASSAEPRYRRDPGVWWKQILKLHKRGKLDAAREEYALLKARFPDFTPPDGPPDWY